MAATVYKIEAIENYDVDAATEAALNVDGINGWDLMSITYKPDASTGKSTATVLYKKSSSSSSVSSSSSSSSSSESLSSSTSNSEAPWMGTGWPHGDDIMQVVIGSRWNFGDSIIHFAEDEVINLKRMVPDPNVISISFSEDGTDVPNALTNRLIFQIQKFGTITTLGVFLGFQPIKANGLDFQNSAASVRLGTTFVPYNFKAFFDTSPNFNDYAVSSYFYSITTSSSFATPLVYAGEIFKSITFINN
jgi:hypothetical protein